MDQAEGDIEPASLAAGEGLDHAVAEAGEFELFGELVGAAFGFGGVDAVEASLGDEFLGDGAGGIGAAALGDISDAPPDAGRIDGQIEPGDGGVAGGWGEEGGEHAEDGGFAGAVGAEESDYFAGFDGEIDAADGVDGTGAGLEGALQAVALDHEFIHNLIAGYLVSVGMIAERGGVEAVAMWWWWIIRRHNPTAYDDDFEDQPKQGPFYQHVMGALVPAVIMYYGVSAVVARHAWFGGQIQMELRA